MDKIVFATFADLMINLAAVWLVIALGAPFLPGLAIWAKIGLLLYNFGFSIICVVIAVWLRRQKK